MITLLLMLTMSQAVWEPSAFPTYHKGYWLSCEGDEQILEHRLNGKLLWEFHLGPGIEFGLYDHQVDGDHSHKSLDNLLGTPVIDTLTLLSGGMGWYVPAHHLWVEVRRAGSADKIECDSFYVKIDHQRVYK